MLKILIIEDDSDIRETLSFSLCAHNILTAENGQVAIEMLTKMPAEALPDLILVDINMPILNGKEFLKFVNVLPTLSHIPKVIMTAGDDASVSALAPIVKKPFEIDVLENTIKWAIRQSKAA